MKKYECYVVCTLCGGYVETRMRVRHVRKIDGKHKDVADCIKCLRARVMDLEATNLDDGYF